MKTTNNSQSQMRMNKKICIISQRYPCEANPSQHVFVKKIAEAMADLDIDVTVIVPTQTKEKIYRSTPVYSENITKGGNTVKVYRPRYFHIATNKVGPIRFGLLTIKQWVKVCQKVIEENKLEFDCFYGHFICLAGICACKLGKIYNKPAYIAYGEADNDTLEKYGMKNVKRDIQNVNGIVAVSTKNKNMLTETGVISRDKIKIFVNGIDRDVFYPRDKIEARKKWNICKDEFVVAFVGQFIERKGILKVDEAVRRIDGVKALYAGQGPQEPEGKHIIFKGILASKEIPLLLSCADVFVFPSLNEGCSNALLEAIGCGVPIIAADLPFNSDILDDRNAILVDANNVEQIEAAIRKLKDNPKLCHSMSEDSIKRSELFDINRRADNILKYIGLRE